MRFYKTDNVSYQMVYDSDEEMEYTEPYDMIPIMNKMNKQIANRDEIIKSAMEFVQAVRDTRSCRCPGDDYSSCFCCRSGEWLSKVKELRGED